MSDTEDDEIVSKISPARIKEWEKWGLEVIEGDLKNGGIRYVGGTLEIREQAAAWTRVKRRGGSLGRSPRLAVVLALDVISYSAQTKSDEMGTAKEIARMHGQVREIASAYGGRVFNTAGDGFMVEFGSAARAVEGAIELAKSCTLDVRIGVHLGDVMVQGNGDLLGHTVNVASRLMAHAKPRTALVSVDVQRAIHGDAGNLFKNEVGTFQLDKMNETMQAVVVS
jgi:class 3 adenylate cyclase